MSRVLASAYYNTHTHKSENILFTVELISSEHIVLGPDTNFLSQVTCTLLAMIATIPLSQLLCFHILLIKKVSSRTITDHLITLCMLNLRN